MADGRNIETTIEVRVGWTPNQWRRFLGQADMTPLGELMSVMIDKIALIAVDCNLETVSLDGRRLDPEGRRPDQDASGCSRSPDGRK